MIPEIDKSLRLWKPEVTIDKLKSAKLDHFLPARTVREHFMKNTKRREIVSLMHTFNKDPKYGLTPFSEILKPVKPAVLHLQTNPINESGKSEQHIP